jgi:hypothetical protein
MKLVLNFNIDVLLGDICFFIYFVFLLFILHWSEFIARRPHAYTGENPVMACQGTIYRNLSFHSNLVTRCGILLTWYLLGFVTHYYNVTQMHFSYLHIIYSYYTRIHQKHMFKTNFIANLSIYVYILYTHTNPINYSIVSPPSTAFHDSKYYLFSHHFMAQENPRAWL